MAKVNNASAAGSNDQENRVKGSEIFVGGLSRTVTESNIHEIFSPHGEIVEVRLMKDHTGASKGFCFVRFATKEAALKAHKAKNGTMLQGKKVGVTLSSDKDQLFFGNLRKEWSSEEFDKLVRQSFEDVVSVDLALVPSSEALIADKKRLNRGFAFVQFSSHAAAARAYRVGSRTDFMLAGGWHPSIDWADVKPELDLEEMTKVKVAFVGNLPTNADEDFLRKLFEPFGKIERVALSRKSHFPVGFVHFANHSEMENAINEMDGKTVPGPHKGASFKIQVAVAKPGEKDKKRVRDETTKPGSQSNSLSSGVTHDMLHPKSKAPRFVSSEMVSDAADPYEEAIIALPSAVKERLLRIFRLGIATRYDVDAQCIATLKELPGLASISVLDQFMLSGAEKSDKRGYLTSLLAKHLVDKFGARRNSSYIPRTRIDNVTEEPEFLGVRRQPPNQAIDVPASRLSSYRPPAELHSYSSSLSEDSLRTRPSLGMVEDPVPSYRDSVSLSSLGRYGEPLSLYRDPVLPSSRGRLEPVQISKLGRLEDTESLYSDPVSRPILRRSEDVVPSYGDRVPRSSLGRREDSISSHRALGYASGVRYPPHLSPSERPAPERPQIKFDPFTGQPYKFDPFTGEPIRPEGHTRHSPSPF